ncbi:hypothetical protein LIA77_06328 [Sarocladium implicatum]|nr:hypothetical protein LIA77_06328 [Sarocladium implicatum]
MQPPFRAYDTATTTNEVPAHPIMATTKMQQLGQATEGHGVYGEYGAGKDAGLHASLKKLPHCAGDRSDEVVVPQGKPRHCSIGKELREVHSAITAAIFIADPNLCPTQRCICDPMGAKLEDGRLGRSAQQWQRGINETTSTRGTATATFLSSTSSSRRYILVNCDVWSATCFVMQLCPTYLRSASFGRALMTLEMLTEVTL